MLFQNVVCLLWVLYFSSAAKASVATENCERPEDSSTFENSVIWTPNGGLRGFGITTVSGKKFLAYQGIPYAKPPVGDLRFKEPVKSSSWSGVRDAIAVSPICIQADFFQGLKVIGQEDCLYVNVYTPIVPDGGRNVSGLPVLVGIHQGGFFFGSSSHVGPAYLMNENIVLVTMNYRLGALGFLSTGDDSCPGNNGLKDQTLALQWVHDNINLFGGDPQRITLFGESAGAGSVHFHMLSPLSRGLFHRGISQSGNALCFWSIRENPLELATSLGKIVGCQFNNTYDLVNCMRSQDAAALVGAHPQLLEWSSYPVALFAPTVEHAHPGAFLDDLPENIYIKPNGVAKVPWITGVNSDELSVNVASILADPALIHEFNQEWETKVGPGLTEIRKSSGNPEVILQRIWKFYMGMEELSFETRRKAVQMLSDRYLVTCSHKAIRYHAQYSGNPVYAYYLNFQGKFSVVQLLGQKPEDWGVAHMDDLIYLTNNTAYYSDLHPNDTEYKLSQLMTSMWANFAAQGVPLVSEDNENARVWEAVTAATTSNLRFLNLSLQPEMVSDPFVERIQFWNELELKDEALEKE